MSSRQLEETVSSAFTVSRETSLIVDPIQGSGPADITGYHRLAVELKHTSRYPVSLNSLTLWEDCFETSWLRHDRILSATVALSGLTSYKSSLTVIKHRIRMYSSLRFSAKPVFTVSRETSIVSIQIHGYHSELQYQKQAFLDCVISALYTLLYWNQILAFSVYAKAWEPGEVSSRKRKESISASGGIRWQHQFNNQSFLSIR